MSTVALKMFPVYFDPKRLRPCNFQIGLEKRFLAQEMNLRLIVI